MEWISLGSPSQLEHQMQWVYKNVVRQYLAVMNKTIVGFVLFQSYDVLSKIIRTYVCLSIHKNFL